MASIESGNRTWICSVVFTDIVGFSTVSSIQTQLAIKTLFNGYLTEALKTSAPDDLIILDTGDGAAICFNDPEEALLSSLSMRNSFSSDESFPNFKLQVRIGVNLGPVKLIKDLNGKLNAVGDGINDAQRVMSFAEPNRILVSRTFYEVARSLGDDYHGFFAYQGLRTDKHVREHTVYALSPPVESRQTVPEAKSAERPGLAWRPEILETLELHLTRAVGPIARLLIKQEERAHPQWEAFTRALAGHIATEKEKKEFLQLSERLKP